MGNVVQQVRLELTLRGAILIPAQLDDKVRHFDCLPLQEATRNWQEGCFDRASWTT